MPETEATTPTPIPPVIHTRIGVQFAPLQNFRSGHFGLFWQECLNTASWIILPDAPASPIDFERFDSKRLRPPEAVADGDFPQVCMRLADITTGRMVQFQANKLAYAWGRHKSPLPGFDEAKAGFSDLYNKLASFAERRSLGPVAPNLWEISYVNKIEPGQLWQTPADWHRVLPGIFPGGGPTVRGFDWSTFDGTWYFVIPPQLGRVRVQVQKAVATGTDEVVLVLQITARGEIGEGGAADWPSGLELGHNAALRVFSELASPEARRAWGAAGEQK